MTNRPLSPHLQIYRWQLTSVMSILHRLTGFSLVIGLVFYTGWLASLASSYNCYQTLLALTHKPFIKGLLVLWSFAFFYHLFNGIRHLFWDIGKGFALKQVYSSGYVVVIVSFVLTILFWWIR